MITDDKVQIGIVIECYNHDSSHRILVVRSKDVPNYHFFYLAMSPIIDFGDEIQMNPAEDKYSVRRGNSKLTFKLTPLVFPGSLLMELITERMSL